MCGVVYDGVDHWGGQQRGAERCCQCPGGLQSNYFYVLYLSATWHQSKEFWPHPFNKGMG